MSLQRTSQGYSQDNFALTVKLQSKLQSAAVADSCNFRFRKEK